MRDSYIKSDVLKEYRKLYKEGAPFALLASLFQVNLILDANVIIKELIWATTKRKNPLGRSDLLEVLEVETVVAWAPTFLEQEVEKNIAVVVGKGARQEDVVVHWKRLRAFIKFVDVGGVPDDGVKYRDPKDIPYILLQRRIEASIVTSDKDVAAMDGRVVPIAVMATLRAYSRAAAVQATFQVGGYTLSSFGLSALVGMTRVASSGFKKMATNVPREVWLALLSMLCVALVIPASRNWLQSRMHTLAAHLGTAGEGFAQLSNVLAAEFLENKLATADALSKVHALLDPAPETPKRPI
jgi:predicted nucleic acid-binding protein